MKHIQNKAVAPVEQLLLTLYTGMPVNPSSYTALCPDVESPVIKKRII